MNQIPKLATDVKLIRDAIEEIKRRYQWPLGARRELDQADESMRAAASRAIHGEK